MSDERNDGGEKVVRVTLCIAQNKEGQVLLGYKHDSEKFGGNLWNGFGGKVDEGETYLQAAVREFKEECKIHDGDIELSGVLEFRHRNQPGKVIEMPVYRVTNSLSEAQSTKEMKPVAWFDKDQLPLEQMWASDKYWLPLFLEGKGFFGQFVYDNKENRNLIEEPKIQEWDISAEITAETLVAEIKAELRVKEESGAEVKAEVMVEAGGGEVFQEVRGGGMRLR